MALPSIQTLRPPRKRRDLTSSSSSDNAFSVHNDLSAPESNDRLRTRTRSVFALISSLLFLVALVFIILIEIGNTSASQPVLNSIYFLKLDLSHVIALSVPQAQLINSIARTLGLHDFYQVGLWNYCQGYGDEVSDCSKPKAMYWFDPVEIILSELLAGATIALPSSITEALSLVRLASRWMFALYMAGACGSFVSVFITPLSLYSRWASLPIAIFVILTTLCTTAATLIGTVMFMIFQNVVHNAEDDVNIIASLGIKMFIFMWTAAVSTLLGSLVQVGMCCCCTSRRDVAKGKKTG